MNSLSKQKTKQVINKAHENQKKIDEIQGRIGSRVTVHTFSSLKGRVSKMEQDITEMKNRLDKIQEKLDSWIYAQKDVTDEYTGEVNNI